MVQKAVMAAAWHITAGNTLNPNPTVVAREERIMLGKCKQMYA